VHTTHARTHTHTPTTPSTPGNNELDQIQRIHAVVGTPPPELLAKLKKRSHHSAAFEFPPCEGSGLGKLLGHVSPDCADLIAKLLAYNPDERLSARQALHHPYFRCVCTHVCVAARARPCETGGGWKPCTPCGRVALAPLRSIGALARVLLPCPQGAP
jgi:hypothetical protein